MWESDINTRVKYMRSIHLPSLPFPPQRWDLQQQKSTQNIKHLMTLENMATLEK